MTHLKYYLKYLLFTFTSIIFCLFIFTIFYYYNFINYNVLKVLELAFLLITIFINSFIFSKKIHIIKYFYSFFLILPFMLISIILSLLFNEFNIKLFIYYFILLFTSLLGIFFYKKKR